MTAHELDGVRDSLALAGPVLLVIGALGLGALLALWEATR